MDPLVIVIFGAVLLALLVGLYTETRALRAVLAELLEFEHRRADSVGLRQELGV